MGDNKFGVHEMYCSFGVMHELKMFGMADNSTNKCYTPLDFKEPVSGITTIEPRCNWTAD